METKLEKWGFLYVLYLLLVYFTINIFVQTADSVVNSFVLKKIYYATREQNDHPETEAHDLGCKDVLAETRCVYVIYLKWGHFTPYRVDVQRGKLMTNLPRKMKNVDRVNTFRHYFNNKHSLHNCVIHYLFWLIDIHGKN